MVAFIDFADVKGSLISDLFLLWLHPSKNVPNFLYQGGEGQDTGGPRLVRIHLVQAPV